MDKKLIKTEFKSKSAQQEIVGFMVIIVIIVVIGVVFLGIYLREDKQIVKVDAELRNFLTASLRYTTDCYKENEPDSYKTLNDLIGECYQPGIGKLICLDGKDSCAELNSTYNWMLNRLWPSGKDRPIKYSKMTFQYLDKLNSSEGMIFMRIKQGNETGCSTIKSAEQLISLDEGKISVNLEVCSGN